MLKFKQATNTVIPATQLEDGQMGIIVGGEGRVVQRHRDILITLGSVMYWSIIPKDMMVQLLRVSDTLVVE